MFAKQKYNQIFCKTKRIDLSFSVGRLPSPGPPARWGIGFSGQVYNTNYTSFFLQNEIYLKYTYSSIHTLMISFRSSILSKNPISTNFHTLGIGAIYYSLGVPFCSANKIQYNVCKFTYLLNLCVKLHGL